ncbi:MAG: TolC family protein [Planctomycetes bacterium]|nr:TolC family protein [Planctomycetota bacterium]
MKFCDLLVVVLLIACLIFITGCVSGEVKKAEQIDRYQDSLVKQGPIEREAEFDANEPNGVGLVRPVGRSTIKPLSTDPNFFRMTSPGTLSLSLRDAIRAVLINSPEVRVISYDPEVAREEIRKQAAAFDPAAFGEAKYDNTDRMKSSTSEIGQANVYQFESGVRKRSTWGSEWSASYALTNSWDDLFSRNSTLRRRYEPVMVFRLKQPLLRDAGDRVNMANLNISRLQHRIAMFTFQQKAEDVVTETIAAYWQLVQARQDRSVFKDLLDATQQTLDKVKGRREIDATDVQIRQAIVSVNSRKAFLVQAEKLVLDAQDKLVRLMADPAVNLIDETEIIPTSEPSEMLKSMDIEALIGTALQNNPVMHQVRMRVDIADINIDVADNQKMIRLDLSASASSQSLDRDMPVANHLLHNFDYNSYGIGLTMEIPLGNRARKAELRLRKIERLKAVTVVQNVADQVAEQTKERLRRIQSSFARIKVQEDTTQAATLQLLAVEESENIRERLTPEYLQVKLQAQESLATAQRARVGAVVEYNVALAQLAQITGHVLGVHQVGLSSPDTQ